MAIKEKDVIKNEGRAISNIEYVGMSLLALTLIILFVKPEIIGGSFDAMLKKAVGPVVNVYLTGTLGTAIILSVMTGRILERLGFTDALVRIFTPLAKVMKITPLIIVPAIYNILGDINASGRITGPSLKKAGATRDEQKIAVATMFQSQQSFSTFMLGLVAFASVGYWAFPIVVIGVLLPVIVNLLFAVKPL